VPQILAAMLTAFAFVGCDYGTKNTYIIPDEKEDAGADAKQSEICKTNSDCEDDRLCNGIERCKPDSPSADPITGCVQGDPPCLDTHRCEEKCVTERCEVRYYECIPIDPVITDRDGDGYDALENGGDDCDDNDARINPGATEVCDPDHRDEDCNPNTVGEDADGDGFINSNCCNVDEEQNLICGNDCDDTNREIYPDAEEYCDGLDNDCNGKLDGPLEDRDDDGHASVICGGTDCDDEDPDTYAGAPELCDGRDNDCSEGGGPAAGEVDADEDGYVVGPCDGDETLPSSGDCDDEQRTRHPDAREVCNGVDDDCDESVDEGLEDCRDPIKQIDVGPATGCAVRTSGTVACWGVDPGGHFGTGATHPHETARNVIDPRETDLVLSRVRSVSLGNRHTCAVHFDGRVSCWGDNGEEGRLGFASSENQIFLPREVVGLDDVVQLSAGGNSTCAVRTEGDVWCWGDNAYGQLGNGTTENSDRPVLVQDLDNVTSVECGDSFACAILQSGAVACWGDMGAHLPEDYRDTVESFGTQPSRFFGLENVKRISAAASHVCVVGRDGSAGCFGANAYGQLGNGRFSQWEYNTQTVLFSSLDIALNKVVDIAAGSWIANRIEWLWDETAHESVQVAVESASGVSCARVANGQLYCWGSNKKGALGIGDILDLSPEAASLYRQNRALFEIGPTDAIEVRATATYVCIRTASAEVWCWGGSLTGQWTSYDTPQRITGFED
jgi:alpha-tubulin suppressor-like RCC1 family protein